MKAVVYDRYGSPNVLRLTAVDPPAPGEGEVLVRVRATSINSWDWGLLAGTFQGRLGFNAWRTPKFKTLGADVAGHIEAVGPNVADFQVGDEVYGDTSANGFGGLAQYVAAPASVLAKKSRPLGGREGDRGGPRRQARDGASDRCRARHRLHPAAQAFARFGNGQVTGKVVVTLP